MKPSLNLKAGRTPEATTSAVAGVWCRVWEEDPIGDATNADRTTLVLWTQAPMSGVYVDLRLPVTSPGRSVEAANAAGFHHPNPSALQATGMTIPTLPIMTTMDLLPITHAKSFAGVLEYTLGDATRTGEALRNDHELERLAKQADGGSSQDDTSVLPLCTCYWKRYIDYQPPTGGYDIGVCASYPFANVDHDGSVEMRETGDDASYAELWRRIPYSLPSSTTSTNPSSSAAAASSSSSKTSSVFAMELLSEDGSKRDGYWVRTNQYFAYAIGRPKTYEEAVKFGCVPKSHELNHSDDLVGKSLHDAINSLVPLPTTTTPTPSDLEADDTAREMQLRVIGSYVCVFGEISNDQVDDRSSSWNIIHSTDPGLVGCTLVGDSIDGKGDTDTRCSCCSTVSLLASDDGGSTNGLEIGATIVQVVAGQKPKVRHWKVVEMDGPTGLPGL